MDDSDIRVTSKIWLIQRNDVRYAVNLHGSREACIVDLDAADTITHHELPPDPVNFFIIRKQGHNEFNRLNTSVRFLNGQTEAIVTGRTRTHIPKLADVLRGITKLCSAFC